MLSHSKRFEEAIRSIQRANESLLQASIAEFPVGCVVTWMHGEHRRFATVAWHSQQYPRVGLVNDAGRQLRAKDTIGLRRYDRLSQERAKL
jgi:hypothetical protein